MDRASPEYISRTVVCAPGKSLFHGRSSYVIDQANLVEESAASSLAQPLPDLHLSSSRSAEKVDLCVYQRRIPQQCQRHYLILHLQSYEQHREVSANLPWYGVLLQHSL